jgi:YD repeat-containing protein
MQLRQSLRLLGMAVILGIPTAALGGLPDLIGTSLSVTPVYSPAHWGDPLSILGEVQNVGSSNAGPFNIGFFLATNQVFSSSAIVFGSQYIGGLNQNTFEIFWTIDIFGDFTVYLPDVNPMPGVTNYYIGMYVNTGNIVPESNTNNNVYFCATPLMLPSGLPHILATSSTPPYTNTTVTFSNVVNDGVGGDVASQTVTIVNDGSALAEITGVSLSGSTNFSITSIADSLQTSFVNPARLSPQNPHALQPFSQEVWVITIQFDPTTNGPLTGTLLITSSDTNNPTTSIVLSGTGAPVPQIALTTPTTLVNFGGQVVDGAGGFETTKDILIQNNGSGPLTVNPNGISLLTGTQFSIVSITSSTQGIITPAAGGTIADNGMETWDIQVTFDPGAVGVFNDALQILSNDPKQPTFIVSLQGQGLNPAQLMASDSAGVIGSRTEVFPSLDASGQKQAVTNILLQNYGGVPLIIPTNGLSFIGTTNYDISTNYGLNVSGAGTTTVNGNYAYAGSVPWLEIRLDPVLGIVITVVFSNSYTNAAYSFYFDPLTTSGGLKNTNGSMVYTTTDPSYLTGWLTNNASGISPVPTVTVNSNLITLVTNNISVTCPFFVSNIVSSTAGVINLLTNSAQIAPNTNETWTVTLVFDPAMAGTLTNTLSIYASNLLTQTTFVAASVSVSGQGLDRPSLVVSNSLSSANGLVMNFGNVLNDGSGGTMGTATLTLSDQGTRPLVISQTGLTLSGGAGFSIGTIYSSQRGIINLSTNSSTIAPTNSEIWTVPITLDPTANGISTATLTIASNDAQSPTQVALSGTGMTPTITLNTPANQLNVSAGAVYNFTWQTTYPIASATITLYLDTDLNPTSGLMPIATGLPITAGSSYAWHVDPAFIGTNYHVYATITDGSVSNGSYAPGNLKIDPVTDFQFLSSITVTNASYVYQYVYNGTSYTGTNQLALGANVVNITNGTAINQVIITRVPSLSQVNAVQYNQLSQVTTTTNANGIVTTLTYDPMGRLVRRQSSNGAVVTYTYNPLGQRTSMTDYTGTTYYGWDDLGRLTAITNGAGLVLSYEYDLAGQETAIVYPGGERIQYTYDNAGRLSTVTNVTHNLAFQYSYDPATGQITKLTRPNGIETDYSYDGMGRLTNILHKTSTGLVAQYGYTLDAMGKATLLTTTLPGVTKLEQYGYDYFDRLTNVIYGDNGVINANDLSISYTYDGNGNRLTMTTRTNNAVTEIRYYNYGSENRLLTVTNQNGVSLDAYTYDPAGNRIQKVTTNSVVLYNYDERNLMTSYVDTTNQITYTCNGDAQRVSQTVNGSLTTYINDPNRSLFEVVQERNSLGTVTASYTFGLTRLATWNGSTATFELTDRLGSVRLVTDSNGTVIQSYNYYTFGTLR